MPILKFWKKGDDVILDNFRLEDISTDTRCKYIDKTIFTSQKYKVDSNTYMVSNDVFFKLSKFLNKTTVPINSMLLKDKNINIIFVPKKSYVFFDGKSINPKEWEISHNIGDLLKILLN